MVSERTRASLPNIESLRRITQSLAMIEAILCPRFDLRYHLFNSKWNEGEMMASMNNGSGDDYFILFDHAGAIIKGFDHESRMSPYASENDTVWRGVLDNVPQEFQSFLLEPAFTVEDTTFCLWRRYIDASWQIGHINYPEGDEDADGSGWMLSILKSTPSEYQEWAQDYHDREINIEIIQAIYEHKPLTNEIVNCLNSDLALADVTADIEEIGYGSVAIIEPI